MVHFTVYTGVHRETTDLIDNLTDIPVVSRTPRHGSQPISQNLVVTEICILHIFRQKIVNLYRIQSMTSKICLNLYSSRLIDPHTKERLIGSHVTFQ